MRRSVKKRLRYSSKLFLWGHSFCGLVSTYVAGERAEDILGLILLEPSYYMPDQYRELFPEDAKIPVMVEEPLSVSRKFVETIKEYDIFESMKKYPREVLIFRGTVHGDEELQLMDTYFGKALESFSQAQLVEIEEADHYFQGEPGVSMTGRAIQFMEEILKEKN